MARCPQPRHGLRCCLSAASLSLHASGCMARCRWLPVSAALHLFGAFLSMIRFRRLIADFLWFLLPDIAYFSNTRPSDTASTLRLGVAVSHASLRDAAPRRSSRFRLLSFPGHFLVLRDCARDRWRPPPGVRPMIYTSEDDDIYYNMIMRRDR